MATPTFLEAGTSATSGFEWYTETSGAFSSQGTVVHDQPSAIKMDPGIGGSTVIVGRNGVCADAGRCISFYYQFSKSVAEDVRFCIISDASFNTVFSVQINAGVLSLAGGPTGTGVTTLSPDAWNRISIGYQITNTTTFTIKVYLNGSLEITGAGTLINTASNMLRLAHSGTTSVATIFYFSDIYLDNRTDSTDCGDIRVTARRPFSNGSANNFGTQVGAGGSGYGSGHAPQVNERPLSETNGWEDTSAVGDQENYTLESAASGDVNLSAATLLARSAWIWAKVDTASVLAKLMDNGTESDIVLTTTPALYTTLVASAAYPSDAAGVGMRSSTTPNTFLYEAGTLLAYLPAPPVPGPTLPPVQAVRAWAA